MIRTRAEEKNVKIPVTIEETIVCNGCGSEIRTIIDEEEQFDEMSQFHEIRLDGGFGDDVIGDMNRVVIHLCLPCIERMLDSMMVIPDVECGIVGQSMRWDEWQKSGRRWAGRRDVI